MSLSLSSEIERILEQEEELNSISDEKFKEVVSYIINFALASGPVNMVKKVAKSPPSQEISDVFLSYVLLVHALEW